MVDIGRDFRATIKRYNGYVYLDIRRHYKDEVGDWKPGVPGVSLSQDRWTVFKSDAPEVVEASADQQIDLGGGRSFGKYNHTLYLSRYRYGDIAPRDHDFLTDNNYRQLMDAIKTIDDEFDRMVKEPIEAVPEKKAARKRKSQGSRRAGKKKKDDTPLVTELVGRPNPAAEALNNWPDFGPSVNLASLINSDFA